MAAATAAGFMVERPAPAGDESAVVQAAPAAGVAAGPSPEPGVSDPRGGSNGMTRAPVSGAGSGDRRWITVESSVSVPR